MRRSSDNGLTPAVAVKATQLGPFHGDPADRLIVATALTDNAPS
jgi:PIN domain nuclease of toxin-antitoxin system